MSEFEKFRDLVKRMREAQKSYFRTRSGADMDRAKRLERMVDKEMRDCSPQALLDLGGE